MQSTKLFFSINFVTNILRIFIIMIGTGSVVLSHIDGWSACREAVMDMEFFMNPDKTAKRSIVVTMKNAFTCVGELKGNVKGMFSYDAGNKTAFSGFMIGKSKVQITGELNSNFETIIKEIKKWQLTKVNY